MRPPVLNLGWIIDTEAMLKYTREHNIDSELCDGEVSFDTCIDALGAMVDHNGIPDDARIQIVFLSDGDYDPNARETGKLNFHIGVRAGTNYEGHITYEDVCRLGNIIAPGVKAQWFLDSRSWQWTRVKSQAPPAQSEFSCYVSYLLILITPHYPETNVPASSRELSVTS